MPSFISKFTCFHCFLLVVLFFVTTTLAIEDESTCPDKNSNPKLKLRDLWAQGDQAAIDFLSGIYEHSPWVAKSLLAKKDIKSSITTVSELATAMKYIVDHDASQSQKLELLKAHPDLAQKVENLSQLTKDSQEEQTNAGLQSMTKEEKELFTKLNTQYKTIFDIPFILAVRHATKYTVLNALQSRINNTKEEEIMIALQQVHKIAWMRIVSKLESNELKGFLTCHVLDTANGCPGTFF